MHTESVGYNKPRGHQGTRVLLPSEVLKLFCSCASMILHCITIIAINCSIICIIPKQKFTILVGIHCRKQANCIIHHGGTLLVASSSSVDSILDHEDAFCQNRAGNIRAVLWVGTTDVWKPSGTHDRTKLISRVINGLGNQRPLVLPQVIRKSKILTNLL